MKASEFLNGLIAKGYNSFTYSEAKEAFKTSDVAMRAVLRRLKQKGVLAQPMNGFYVIVPPEYRVLGCRPAEQFIHELMHYINTPYYIGLLSAAQIHGAAHHRPQQLQVVTKQKRRPIICGRVKIVFITRKDCSSIPTIRLSKPHGYIVVSSPEATTMDLVSYPNRSGGMDNVLAVLTDMKDKISADKLYRLAIQSEEITWIQRLGYLFELIKANALSKKMLKAINNRHAHVRPLIINIKKSPIQKRLTVSLESHKKLPKTEAITGNQRFLIQSRTNNSQKPYSYHASTTKIVKHNEITANENINEKWKLIINKKLERDT